MKNKLFLMMLVVIMGILAACGTAEKETTTSNEGTNTTEAKKVLKMGTSADYPPFEFVDTAVSDEIIGFDVDLANLIGEKLGYEIKIENIDFNSLIPSIQAGKFDFVIAGMSPTPKREKSVDFSIAYNETVQMVVTKKTSGIEKLEDLEGKKVGAQVSSIQLDLANDLAKDIPMTVESRDLIPQVIQEIMTDRFDAAVIEDITAKNYVEKNKDLAAFAVEVDDPDYKAVVFQEGSPLKAEFDKAIQELIDEGKIEKLREKWFVVEE